MSDIPVYCEKCGSELDAKVKSLRLRGLFQREVFVTPCQGCLDDAKEEGSKEPRDSEGSGV